MLKKQILLVIFIVLILMAACNLDSGISNAPVTSDNQESGLSRGICDGLDASKSVTYTNPSYVTFTGPGSELSAFFSGITNGNRNYYYIDSCYAGSIPSVSFNMIYTPQPVYAGSSIYTCTVTVNYAGSVLLTNTPTPTATPTPTPTPNPCVSYALIKSVTYTDPSYVTFTGLPSDLSPFFSNIYNGGRTYYYTEYCYAGYIKSVSMNMIRTPQPVYSGSSIYTCTVTVNYAGTVNRL